MFRNLVPVQASIAGHDGDEGLFTTEDMYDETSREPIFTSTQAASFFFGKNTRWLLNVTEGVGLHFDGTPIQVRWHPDGEYREYRLYDIERIAHALAGQGRIGLVQLLRTVDLVRLVAQNYGYLEHSYKPVFGTDYNVTVNGFQREATDDMTGEPGASLRTFAISGTEYYMDMTDENWGKFLEMVAPYVKAASLSPRRTRGTTTEVRNWARSAGYDVGMKGPISQEVLAAWHQSTLTS